MPLVFQETITRADLHQNRSALFIFGDNEQRRGLGGQAAEMRGEPNAHGIRTKKAPSMERWALWTDSDFSRVVSMIRADFEKPYHWLSAGKLVIFPSAGVGTGRADLRYSAPKIFNYIRKKIELLAIIAEEIKADQVELLQHYYDSH